MAVLQAQLTNSNGYFLSGRCFLIANEINSNRYLLHSISNLSAQFISHLSFSNGYSLHTLSLLTAWIDSGNGQYQQYLSSLVRFFGDNVTQSATHLVIDKISIGLQPTNHSTAESLLVAILLRVLQKESNSLVSNAYVAVFSQYIESGDRNLITTNLVVHLYMKTLYEDSNSELLGNVMTNYTIAVDPDQFT